MEGQAGGAFLFAQGSGCGLGSALPSAGVTNSKDMEVTCVCRRLEASTVDTLVEF